MRIKKKKRLVSPTLVPPTVFCCPYNMQMIHNLQLKTETILLLQKKKQQKIKNDEQS